MAIHNPFFIAGFAILYLILIFLIYSLIRKHELLNSLFPGISKKPVTLYFTEKSIGFLLFGIVPYILFIRLSELIHPECIFTSGTSGRYWYILASLLIIISVLTFISSRNKSMQERYPQIRIKIWMLKYSLISIAGWIIYILGYEFLLRGILWFCCFRAFGFWPALLINIVLYAIVHLDQGMTMSLGAIPVGIIFCLLTFYTGSFLFAFLLHCWMAINNELFSIYHNPDMSFRIELKRYGL